MRCEVEAQSPRARPVSAGLWTLFSWLRRDEAASSDSLSSAGSARSAASFAFLPPARCARAAPRALPPPPPPPTDSYRRRVHDWNQRRLHDRDLTLHRKYGLYRGDATVGYDVTSLPLARRSAHDIDKQERDRRATSESLQRRTPYVPGKRRAPPPPGRNSVATLPYRHSRKRRAPQPPIKFKEGKENVESHNTVMSSQPNDGKTDLSMDCKSEKYVRKEEQTKIETKPKQEKNFLKQIFDNKKRRSAIETSSIKILPSISELDKQAAEIIETYKREQNNNNNLNMDYKRDTKLSDMPDGARWTCITCLRRYDASVNKCTFCLSSQKPVNSFKETNTNYSILTQTNLDVRITPTQKHREDEERQQLKKMLKEMKDSLPKKHKPAEDVIVKNNEASTSVSFLNNSMTESPTLRIGGPKQKEPMMSAKQAPSSSKNVDNTNEIVRKILLHDSVNLQDKMRKDSKELIHSAKKNHRDGLVPSSSNHSKGDKSDDNIKTKSIGLSENKQLNTPLKISSLLNPIYIPKQQTGPLDKNSLNSIKNVDDAVKSNKDVKTNNVKIQDTSVPSTSNMPNVTKVENGTNVQIRKKSPPKQVTEPLKLPKATVSTESQTSSNQKSVLTKVDEINQHARRRELINQLENSIAKGDERAAADAAAKLAQLRLSCSVLSFTSQILGEITNPDGPTQKVTSKNENQNQKIESQPVILNNNANKVVLPISKQNLDGSSNKNQETKTNEAAKKQPDKSEPGCSKSTVEKVLHMETIPIQASTSQQGDHANESDMISISVWIEDKDATRGPIKLQINREARVGALRLAAEAALGIAGRLQRWVVGRALPADHEPLALLAGPNLDVPFYLCLVESDAKLKSTSANKEQSTYLIKKYTAATSATSENDNDKTGDVYTELMQLERQALVPNSDTFECEVCMENCDAGHGVVLRECVHSFCRNCLADMIRHCEEPAVSCPAMGCPGTLHEREIRALVSPGEYERWLARGLAAAESGTRNAFHCRTRDCTGWAFCEAGVRKFPCPVCKRNNCVPCQAIHEGETCEQYRTKLQQAAHQVPNQTDEGTKALLESLISRGEALECPECSAIITKKWGCDWVKCSACKTEICWVTRGRRWGPAGRGDTSAGCRCGVDGKRCHPSCGYCH